MLISIEQFVERLTQSGVMSAADLAKFQDSLPPAQRPRDVQALVTLLYRAGKLTKYQAKAVYEGKSLVLGEYVVLDMLGEGGMGVVLKAQHRRMERVVAVKVLSAAAIKQAGAIERFQREVKAAARLSHPNIVTAYDAGEHAGTHYLVMEYVVGCDLSAIVKEQGPLPLRQAIDCMQQAARGLEYAHKHGVVHRDVKPSNLLLDHEGVVKILDMGLARLIEKIVDAAAAMEITGTGQILGTIDYMSPEQAEDVRSADHRSDIYSLGCTLFFLLTRRPAYVGETIMKRILAHRSEPIPSVTEFRPDCPETLDAAIRWMLAKRPEDRPQTMAEVIVALESCLEKPGAVPPLGPQLPERSEPAQNWLDDLVHEGATPSAKGALLRKAMLASPAKDDSRSRAPKTGTSGSTIRGRQQETHGPGAKTAAAATRGNTWKTVAASASAAVVLVAIVMALIFSRAGTDRKAPKKPPPSTEEKGAAAKGKTSAASAPDDAKNDGAGTPDPQPNWPIQGSSWGEAWADTQGRADRLVAQRKFADAIREYSTLSGRFHDPLSQQQIKEAMHRIETEADAAFEGVETDAREYLRQQRFVQARAVLQAALTTYGPVPAAGRAKKLMAEIDRAERQAPSPAEKQAEAPAGQETPALPAELRKQRQLDATFAKGLAVVESRVAGWDFQGAEKELAKVHFEASELTARLAQRREQVRRMAGLKDRMLATINQADPPLKKSDLALRGINGELNKADAEGITATLPNDKRELLAWPDLGPKAMNKLLALVVRREDSGDWLAAGLLGLAGQDVQSAERYFDKAQSLGADIAPYRALLATKDFAKVRELLDKRKYADSDALLTALGEKYGSLPWFTANRAELDAAAKEAKRGLREREAEAVYAQAAGRFHDGDLYELKPLVERLKTQYADSAVLADPQRKPSLAELEKAVVDLGPLVRVRNDGKGDAKTIQEAVNNAAGNATIQIEEAGPWTEQIVVPSGKEGLTICGKRGLVPVITTAGAQNSYSENFLVHSPQLSLERLVIVHAGSGGPLGTAITADKTALFLRGVLVHGHIHASKLDSQQSAFAAGVRVDGDVVAKDSVFFVHVDFKASCSFQNVLVCGGANCGADSRLRHCTIDGPLQLSGMSSIVSDCIVSTINAANDSPAIEHCDVFGDNPYANRAVPGKGCLNTPPRFADPKSLDFRLLPGSPCRKAASDGGDMGVAGTPEIQALLKLAAELRSRPRGK